MTRHGDEQLDAHRWRGLAVLGLDGTTLRVPESDENRAHFTLPSSGEHRESADPQARMVGLMALGSHFLLDLKVGTYTESEESLSSSFDEHLPDHGVLMVDRGLMDDGRFYRYQQRGAPLACPGQEQPGVDGAGGLSTTVAVNGRRASVVAVGDDTVGLVPGGVVATQTTPRPAG
ncbi:hypothetical protein ACFFLM_18160 [Deinococcus oregonensis]|uniref:Transposase IS4 family protein n=1 Tax=Deinococcus oregonensis TaxID=1805970 RepID=A0ABV6B288_9DEIO